MPYLTRAMFEKYHKDGISPGCEKKIQEREPEKPAFRHNKYRARCTICGSWVPAGGGALKKSNGGKWYTMHMDCSKTGAPEVGQ